MVSLSTIMIDTESSRVRSSLIVSLVSGSRARRIYESRSAPSVL